MILDRDCVTRFATNLNARGKQPATVESYCRDAQRFLDYLDRAGLSAEQLEAGHLVDYQDHLKLGEGERDNSVRRTVIGIRQFFRFLTESRVVSHTPFDLVPIPARDERLPRSLAEEDVETLLTVAMAGRPECKAMRDTAIVSLLAHEGVKANELISLRWTDYLNVDGVATLSIPGTRTRAIALSPETTAWIEAYRRHYLNISHPQIVTGTDKRMFIAFKGRDAASPLPKMTRHGLKFILYELGDKAMLKHLNTEQLRHFAVGYLIGHGRTPEEIMTHLGLRRMGNIAKHLARTRAARAGANSALRRPAVERHVVVEGGARG